MSDQAKAEEAVQQHLALLEAELGRPMVLEEQQVATWAYPLGARGGAGRRTAVPKNILLQRSRHERGHKQE